MYDNDEDIDKCFTNKKVPLNPELGIQAPEEIRKKPWYKEAEEACEKGKNGELGNDNYTAWKVVRKFVGTFSNTKQVVHDTVVRVLENNTKANEYAFELNYELGNDYKFEVVPY